MAESDSKANGRLGLASQVVIALTGVATVVANIVLTTRSLNLTKQVQDEQRQVVKVDSTMASWSAAPDPQQAGRVIVSIDYALQNVGDKPIRGCGTYYEPVAADLTPVKYWPSIMEPGGIQWTLDSGITHETTDKISFDRSSEGDEMLVELWFECVYPKVVSRSTFLRLDLAAATVTMADLDRTKPLDSYDRYSIVERADGRTPHPRPN
ncbi:hypothetical protein [Amycolatopsis pigmentata]|uniref:DUF4352 domain-containing protein n=1 Tax=Amycolatopsis pigmentata TaxID=450801 RepID=A0ABW5G401_9PSEU